MLFACLKFTIVAWSIRLNHNASSMSKAIFMPPLVACSIRPSLFAFTMFKTIFPTTLVTFIIWPSKNACAIKFVFFKLTLVASATWPSKDAYAILFVKFPIPLVAYTTRLSRDAFAMFKIIYKLSRINYSITIVGALTIKFVVSKLTVVSVTVLPDQSSLAMSHPIAHFSCVIWLLVIWRIIFFSDCCQSLLFRFLFV